MTVGVFGGAFNPPHLGHVELARRGIERFDLDRLLVRVVEDPAGRAGVRAAR
jgi:nicotinate-nucleotide adenylyltransferase